MLRTLSSVRPPMPMRLLRAFAATWLLLLIAVPAMAQNGEGIPTEYRGAEVSIARGILDGNLIETNFRNHGELARWNDAPWGVWPRGIGGRHIDGIGIIVAGRVPAERAKWPAFGGRPDTLVNPVILTYRDAGKRLGPGGALWGWLPLNGFHNPSRINSQGQVEPTPALSDDPTSWPTFWPDRLDNPDDPGWAGQWNGAFGRGVFNADLESYYVMDDYSDMEYAIDPETGQPFSPYGVFYADPADSTKGGMGLQARVRIFQWANLLAEDTMFILYRLTNTSPTSYRFNLAGDEGIFFAQVMDYGLGNEEGDENAAFDPQQDVTFAFDQDGIGQHPDGTLYTLGYTGFAFLESPSRGEDGLDNDEDGITDEGRFSGPGTLIIGQDAIEQSVNASYDIVNFERFNGPLQDLPAYKAGYWWTGDENLDWRSFEDDNGNGQWDSGESLNDDVGRDGKGPFDLFYEGPDDGEADGMPTVGEPNFDELDVDESDQIGLTGNDLNARPFYESGDNLRDDTWLFDRILNFAQFPLGTAPAGFTADVEPFLLYVSGPVSLAPNAADFFSTAWIFGADEVDFFKNRRTVQSIYDADYNFAQPPFTPTLTAVPGDGRVTLTWDTLSVSSFDRFSQAFDFEGYKLYRGTNALLSDSRTISNIDGTPTFFKPVAQWDLINGIQGPVTVLDGEGVYRLGTDSGLSFFYVDDNVTNGLTYYYALVAYDHGVIENGEIQIDPQENVFNISLDLAGNIVGQSQNAAVIIPRSKPAGYVEGAANEDLSHVTEGIGSGSINVQIVTNENVVPNSPYQVRFYSEDAGQAGAELFKTSAYDIFDVAKNEVVLAKSALTPISPMVDGFVVEFNNEDINRGFLAYDTDHTGYVSNPGSANELYGLDPSVLDGVDSNWIASIAEEESGLYVQSPWDYELRWVNPSDSTYRPPRFGVVYLRVEVPIFAFDASSGQQIDFFIDDVDKNREFGPGDAIIFAEKAGLSWKFRHRVAFSVPEGQTSDPPDAGDIIKISVVREFYEGDYFQFTLREAVIDADLARDELKDIAVVPNPYVGASAYEPRSQITGRGERRIRFINLPSAATITIFNLRGERISTLRHDGIGSDGSMFWDLQTEGGQDLAFGVYIYHVEADGIGEHIGKFAVVK
ncbi:MAG: hypothetical protein ACI80V_002285 [Rhodothermales bacterium]|jgi:hypothetical protein